MVPVIVLAQLSVVVGAVAVAEHSPVTSAKVGVVGASLSFTVTSNVQLENPTAFVAVAVTETVPTLKTDPEAIE